jgi:hypothetical protein
MFVQGFKSYLRKKDNKYDNIDEFIQIYIII